MRLLGLAVKTLLTLLLLSVLVIGATLAVLHYAPNRLAPLVERGASHFLGRAITVGELSRVSLGEDVVVEARALALANASWAGPEPMLSVRSVSLALNLPSVFRPGSIMVRQVEIEGLALGLLAPEGSEPNWTMDLAADSTDEDEQGEALFQVIFERAALDDIRVSFSDPDRQVEIHVDQFKLDRDDATGMSSLFIAGIINELPLSGGGIIGPTEALQSGRNLQLDLALALGKLQVKAAGSVADALQLEGADLLLDIRAPHSRRILDLLGLEEVRDGPLVFEGRLADAEPGLVIEAEGELADFGLGAHGIIRQPAALEGVDLDFYLDGPSMAEAGVMFGVDGFKDVPFDIAGKLHRRSNNLKLKDGRLRADQGLLTVSGELPNFPDIDDWQADIAASKLDLSVLGTVLGVELPQLFCDVDGRLFSDDHGVELVDLKVTDGDVNLVIDGVMGELPDLHNTDLKMQFTGNDLTRLRALIGLETLPAAPYKLAGKLSRDANGWRLGQGELHSQGFRVDVTGELDRLANPQRVDGQLKISSPDFPRALRDYGIGFETLAPLSLGLTGNARLVDGGFEVSDVLGHIGSVDVSGHGLLSNKPGFADSRITIEGRGDNFGEALAAFAEAEFPGQPFRLSLDSVYHAPLVEVDRLEAAIGQHSLSGHMKLESGAGGQLARGRLSLRGDSVRNLLTLAGLDLDVNDGSYKVAANLQMTADYLAVDNLDADIVNSDLDGNLRLEYGEIPRLDIDLHSNKVHLASLWPTLDPANASAADVSDETEERLMEVPTSAEMKERVIPDVPLPLDWINRVNGHWRYRLDRAWAREGIEARVVADLRIEDGVLESRQLGWDGTASRGWVDIRVDATQLPYRAELETATDRIPLLWLIAGRDMPRQKATYRGNLAAVGSTVREAAASLDGELVMRASGAQLSNQGLDLILGDVVGSVFDRLNPFSVTEEYTEVECLVGALRADNGLIKIEPGAVVRMDKVDVVSRGTVDLNTEALNIAFNTRSRKGIGISAAKAITPYLKVAGNLANPWLTLDPEAVALSGTAAIATAGLSVLAEGLYDRWIATAKSPCQELFKQIRRDPDYKKLLVLPEPGLTNTGAGASINAGAEQPATGS